jgi:hypothetical protein
MFKVTFEVIKSSRMNYWDYFLFLSIGSLAMQAYPPQLLQVKRNVGLLLIGSSFFSPATRTSMQRGGSNLGDEKVSFAVMKVGWFAVTYSLLHGRIYRSDEGGLLQPTRVRGPGRSRGHDFFRSISEGQQFHSPPTPVSAIVSHSNVPDQ